MNTRTLSVPNTPLTIEARDHDSGVSHEYHVVARVESIPGVAGSTPYESVLGTVAFQDGPTKEAGANGLTEESLLIILKDRLEAFQRGPYLACNDNEVALAHVGEAFKALNARSIRRTAQNVEGTSQKDHA